MQNQSFGMYMRSLRQSRSPAVTQEALANAVGRSKMTISQFEQGKNAPPQGELLDRIVTALQLDSDEERRFRFLAAESRRTIPGDIKDYFFQHPAICDVIRAAQKAGADDATWLRLASSFAKDTD